MKDAFKELFTGVALPLLYAVFFIVVLLSANWVINYYSEWLKN